MHIGIRPINTISCIFKYPINVNGAIPNCIYINKDNIIINTADKFLYGLEAGLFILPYFILFFIYNRMNAQPPKDKYNAIAAKGSKRIPINI